MKKNKYSTKVLGSEVRDIRRLLGGLSQQSLADLIGSSQSEVSRWERQEATQPVPEHFADRIRRLVHRRRRGQPLLPDDEELVEYHPASSVPPDAPRLFASFPARKRTPSGPKGAPPSPAPEGQPAAVPAEPGAGQAPAAAAPEPTGRAPRWSTRAELRAMAAGLAVLIVGSAFTVREELRKQGSSRRPGAPSGAPLRSARTPGHPPLPPAEAAPPVPANTNPGDAGVPHAEAADGGVAWDMKKAIFPQPEAPPDPIPPAMPLPAHPARNQKRPPCFVPPRGNEVEINDACYIKVDRKPPCGEETLEFNGGCYIAIEKREPKPSVETAKGAKAAGSKEQ